MKVGLGVTSIDSITLGDGEGQAERAPSRLIETEADVAVFAVTFQRPSGLAP